MTNLPFCRMFCMMFLVVIVGDRTSRRLCHSRSSPVYLPRRREDRISSARQENSEEDRSWRLGGGGRFIFQCRIFIFPQCLSEGNELCTGHPRRGEKRWCQVTLFKFVARRKIFQIEILFVFQINPLLYFANTKSVKGREWNKRCNEPRWAGGGEGGGLYSSGLQSKLIVWLNCSLRDACVPQVYSS